VDRVGDGGEGHVGGGGGQSNNLSFLFLPVKEDSYPELCAQQADEGGGSLLL
jgi:hypothetical protein